ncbi:hypothetical protein [Arthrobacter sp. HLT1-20]
MKRKPESFHFNNELPASSNGMELSVRQGVVMTQVLSEHLLELARQARSAAPPGEENEFAFEAVYAELQVLDQISIGLDSQKLVP